MIDATRSASLKGIGALDESLEVAFHRLVWLAANALQAPLAAASLVDEARIWLMAKVGTTESEIPREKAFCAYAVASNDLLVVEDASLDPRFASSPLVMGFGVRFYAGAPVNLSTGEVVGTVCVLDIVARPAPDAMGVALLRGLAAAVGHLIDLRHELIARQQAERKLAEHARLLELAEDMAGLGTWRLDFQSGALNLSPSVFKIYGLDASRSTPDVDALLAMYAPADRSRIVHFTEDARTEGCGFATDARLRRASDGAVCDVRIKARVEEDADGRPAALIGVFQDVTVEKSALALLDGERIEADRRAERMHRLASIDALTGMPNRRAFLERAEEALRCGTQVGLALLDIDHFKAINDRYGHAAGDLALADFGRSCARQFGSLSCLGRIGGEEFAILFEGEKGSEAARLVEELRQTISSEHMGLGAGLDLRLTFSAGLARSLPEDTWPALFARADKALYRAKLDGRDRTAVAA